MLVAFVAGIYLSRKSSVAEIGRAPEKWIAPSCLKQAFISVYLRNTMVDKLQGSVLKYFPLMFIGLAPASTAAKNLGMLARGMEHVNNNP
jgi:hypothetical protein